MKMMSRAYLKQIRREAILKGNVREMNRINKIAKFNGIAF